MLSYKMLFVPFIFLILFQKCLTQNTTTTTTSVATTDLTNAQIGGIVVGIVGIVILFLMVLVCLCETELRALCFLKCPIVYRKFAKKSKQNTTSYKKYDLFISYDKANRRWVNDLFLKFLKTQKITSNYCLHYDDRDDEKREVYTEAVRQKLNSSSNIILILTDAYLENEWNDLEFRSHVRNLVSNKHARLTCIQMNDVTDEEVEEYVRSEMQMRKFNSFEIDEFYFWTKIKFFLLKDRVLNNTSKNKSDSIVPVQLPAQSERPFSNVVVNDIKAKVVLDFPVFTASTDRPIIYLYNSNTNNIDSKNVQIDEYKKYERSHHGKSQPYNVHLENEVNNGDLAFTKIPKQPTDDSYKQSLKAPKQTQFLLQNHNRHRNSGGNIETIPEDRNEMGSDDKSIRRTMDTVLVTPPEGFNDESWS